MIIYHAQCQPVILSRALVSHPYLHVKGLFFTLEPHQNLHHADIQFPLREVHGLNGEQIREFLQALKARICIFHRVVVRR